MSEFSNDPIVPESGPTMSLVETWIAAVTKPNEGTFAQIAAQPGATAGKAFLWVFLASTAHIFCQFDRPGCWFWGANGHVPAILAT